MRKQILWDYLDECGLPFREPSAEILYKHSTKDCIWSKQTYCELNTRKPFIKQLADPLFFILDPQDKEKLILSKNSPPPETLSGYVREYNDEYKNYQLVYQQLKLIFGAGQDSSCSNTKARLWKFESASLSICIFPRELQHDLGINQRHELIPGSETECSIEIIPAYYQALSPEEQEALLSYQPAFNYQAFSHTNTLHRRFRGKLLPDIKNGFGFDAKQKYFIRLLSPEIVALTPTKIIANIRYTRILPAKGSGGISVEIGFNDVLFGQRNICILSTEFSENAHLALAKDLAQQLKVPFTIEEYYDV